ncbi:hypothetical protein MY1_0642 [Nitrosarchaeum koreense MY1]|uniref:Uncharacterized protein n=1 Tax=Nitrosarchaeum koreense MY1 TaxID=1001994 RepID=F9CVV3_9ARCH|nr:hypothetical protein MY1_0642 [Nitrosarchaeum koreense MY1]
MGLLPTKITSRSSGSCLLSVDEVFGGEDNAGSGSGEDNAGSGSGEDNAGSGSGEDNAGSGSEDT